MKTIYLFILCFILSCANENDNQNKASNNLLYDKAWEFKDNGDVDNALINFYKAKDFFLKKHDSIGAGKSLINIGIILTEKGDYFGAQETSLDATNYFDKRKPSNYEFIKSNYNNLGIASYNLKDYDNALKFYNLAIKFSNNILDTRIYLNNKAKTLQEIKKYDEALKIYNKLFRDNSKNKIEYARTLTNLAKTKWLKSPPYNPIPEFKKSLEIRLKEEDKWGQNSSYAHMADYYIRKNKLDSAKFFAQKMYIISKQLKSPDDQLEALQKLIISDNPKNSKKIFLSYQKLNDSIFITRSKAKNQFALIRFDVEKQKLENEQLKSVNLKKNIGITALALLLISGTFWYLKRKKRLQQEKELEVKNTELKMSKKVHDKVANKVYHVMSEVENIPEMDKEILLDKLESIYNISRDISYEGKDPVLENNFAQQLSQMLNSYSSETIKISTIGNEESFWEGLSDNAKVETFYILQELMTNMKKHSQANRVLINFERENNNVSISYSDNGIGIQTYSPKNGLQNTGTRIKSIGGKINFETKTEKGLKITLLFPIKN